MGCVVGHRKTFRGLLILAGWDVSLLVLSAKPLRGRGVSDFRRESKVRMRVRTVNFSTVVVATRCSLMEKTRVHYWQEICTVESDVEKTTVCSEQMV